MAATETNMAATETNMAATETNMAATETNMAATEPCRTPGAVTDPPLAPSRVTLRY